MNYWLTNSVHKIMTFFFNGRFRRIKNRNVVELKILIFNFYGHYQEGIL